MRELTRHPHWVRSKPLILTLLGCWLAFSAVVSLNAVALNKIALPVLEAPLGVCLAAQGWIVMFAVVLLWFWRRLE